MQEKRPSGGMLHWGVIGEECLAKLLRLQGILGKAWGLVQWRVSISRSEVKLEFHLWQHRSCWVILTCRSQSVEQGGCHLSSVKAERNYLKMVNMNMVYLRFVRKLAKSRRRFGRHSMYIGIGKVPLDYKAFHCQEELLDRESNIWKGAQDSSNPISHFQAWHQCRISSTGHSGNPDSIRKRHSLRSILEREVWKRQQMPYDFTHMCYIGNQTNSEKRR